MPKKTKLIDKNKLLTPNSVLSYSSIDDDVISSQGGPRVLSMFSDPSGAPMGTEATFASVRFNLANDFGVRAALITFQYGWQQTHDAAPGTTTFSIFAGVPEAEVTIETVTGNEDPTVTDNAVSYQGSVSIYSTFNPQEEPSPVEGIIQAQIVRFNQGLLYSNQAATTQTNSAVTTVDINEDISVIWAVDSTDATGTRMEDVQGYAILWPLDDTWHWDQGISAADAD